MWDGVQLSLLVSWHKGLQECPLAEGQHELLWWLEGEYEMSFKSVASVVVGMEVGL